MSRIDLQAQPNGYKVQWSYLPKQFSAENIEEILDLLRKFVPTGDFTLGKPVREFEEKFAAMIGARHSIGVNSGTAAIHGGAIVDGDGGVAAGSHQTGQSLVARIQGRAVGDRAVVQRIEASMQRGP